MNRALMSAPLLITTFCPFVSNGKAEIIQDRQLQSDYLDRPAPPASDSARKDIEARLAEARERYNSDSNNAELIIWLGRRQAYLGRFREAIETFSEGISKFPKDARFYRHRGHRYITVRRFDLAIKDLTAAARLIKGKPDEVEPDGQPNARNIPTSTLQFNIWYHLGLAYYLTAQNQQALRSYRECLKVSKNPDALAATSHWLYMTLRRLNRDTEAAKVLKPFREGMDIIENTGYYHLLLMYKGLASADALLAEVLKQGSSAGSHSVLYGIANWHLYNGRRSEALKIFGQMLDSEQWTSFGYIAAEADVKRVSDKLF